MEELFGWSESTSGPRYSVCRRTIGRNRLGTYDGDAGGMALQPSAVTRRRSEQVAEGATSGRMTTTEQTTGDLWRKATAQIPNTFARLVYFASLRNPRTDRYENWPMAQILDEETVDRIVHKSHQRTFEEWLCLGLEQQNDCLDSYFSTGGQDRRAVVASWISEALFDNFVPASGWEVERQLYATDLEVLLNQTSAAVCDRNLPVPAPPKTCGLCKGSGELRPQ